MIFTKAVLDKKGASANERFVPGSVRSGGRVWAVNVEGKDCYDSFHAWS